jgi:hypothetical protein
MQGWIASAGILAIFPKRNSAPPERRYSIGYRARDILSPEF